MRSEKIVEIYTGDRDDAEGLPRATAHQRITGGMRAEDIFGRCPPDTFDGFEEAIQEMRRGFGPAESAS